MMPHSVAEIFITISTVIIFLSYSIYAKAILRKQAKPHRTTRFVLLLITVLTTASLFATGDRTALWMSGASAVFSIVIFLLTLRYGMGGWSRSDISALAIALVGIGVWISTKNPTLGLYASILADFTGMIPTLIKTYRHPETEVWTFFGLDALAATLTMLALPTWSIEAVSYPLYILLVNICMVGLVLKWIQVRLDKFIDK